MGLMDWLRKIGISKSEDQNPAESESKNQGEKTQEEPGDVGTDSADTDIQG